jgi:hypothetical protein
VRDDVDPPAEPLVPLRDAQLVVGWTTTVYSGLGFVGVLIEYPHWWTFAIAVGLCVPFTGFMYWTLRGARRRVAAAPMLPAATRVITRREVWKRPAFVLLGSLVVLVVLSVVQILPAPLIFGWGVAYILNARWIKRIESAERVAIVRGRSTKRFMAAPIFRLPKPAAGYVSPTR